VAVLVPDEFVDGLGEQVEAIVGVVLGAFSLDALQLGNDPAVGLREVVIAVRRAIAGGAGAGLAETAILSFAVHQYEARGVPQLVAEVAIAFAALHVELDVAAGRGQREEGEAQRICTETRDALGEFLLGALGDLLGLLGVHQAGGALGDEIVEADAVDEVDRVKHIALGLGHLLAFAVA